MRQVQNPSHAMSHQKLPRKIYGTSPHETIPLQKVTNYAAYKHHVKINK